MPDKNVKPVDLTALKRVPLASRDHKVTLDHCCGNPVTGGKLQEFIDHLPRVLAAESFLTIVEKLVCASQGNKSVMMAMGAHVIKCGLSPLLIELMRRDMLSLIAMNGAGAIHDLEFALIGSTSEDVRHTVRDGTFGMAEETGLMFSRAVAYGVKNKLGLGEALGRTIIDENAPHRDHSVCAAAVATGTPLTVHCAIGTDTVHTFGELDAAGLGALSHVDFRSFCSAVGGMGAGSVYLNIGSAVILPEVFLKAVAVARNLGKLVEGITRVNMDMIQHYRPCENVLRRIDPEDEGGGYALTGHHEIMLPLLVWSWLNGLS